MIHIDLKPEPSDFDIRVRQPGNKFIAAHPNPKGEQWRKNNFWSRCNQQLYDAYGGICAYSGEWFSRTTTSASVDHFYPKSSHPEKAYEWDNYRLTTSVMNVYKGDKIVLDPFEIQNGDLELDFPSCLVKPRKDMSPAEKSKALSTIQILHLNDEDQANRRCEILMEYICGDVSRSFLESKYPFIAEELDRQNLYDKIKSIIKLPPWQTHFNT